MKLDRTVPIQTCHVKSQCHLSTALTVKETKLHIKLLSYKTRIYTKI